MLTVIGTIILFGYGLLVLVCIIPNSYIMKNVESSADKMNKEGIYPDIFATYTFIDNYTDADCISVTINQSTENPFYNALNGYQNYGETNGLEALYGTINEGQGVIYKDHSYLWNGFRIWLRPLLLRYSISDIRTLVSWLNVILFVILMMIPKKTVISVEEKEKDQDIGRIKKPFAEFLYGGYSFPISLFVF